MKSRKKTPLLTLLLLALALTAFFVVGCSKPQPPPMATETPAQMNQGIKDQAAQYKAFRESHPNVYQSPQSGKQ